MMRNFSACRTVFCLFFFCLLGSPKVFAQLPAGWTSEDIGAVSAMGSATLENGILTMSGSGTDIGGTADEFFYFYKNASGDFDVSARINSLSALDTAAKAGIMVRESNAANSTYLLVAINSSNEVVMRGRFASGGASQGTTIPGASMPQWVRITRTGNTFNGYYSADGQSWTAIGTPVVLEGAPTGALLGFAITSHSDGNLAEASITETNLLDLTPSGGSENWTSEDIGDPGAAGSTVIANGALTITGSGNDIWYNADDFHYYYKTLSGDIDAIIKVDSFSVEDTDAKVGIMIRESNADNSKHVSVFVHDSNNFGVGLQRRTSTGGGSAATNIAGTVPPAWLRLVKSGDSYTAYQSADGVSWTQVGETLTVSMSSALVGIAMCSNIHGALASATITESNFFDLGEEPVVTAPAAPTNLTTALISNEIQLDWTDNSDDEDGFLIERKINEGTFELLDSLGIDQTSYNDLTISAGNTYTYRINSYNTAGNSAYNESNAIDVPGSTGSEDWISEDIGDPGAAGSTVIANGALTITGSGNDIWYNADDFHYYYKTLSGDIDAIIKVDSVEQVNTSTKVGLMIRESNAAGAKHVSVFVHAGSNFGVGLQRRTSTGGGSAATNVGGTVPPVWLRLVKSGDNYNAYQSADGASWIQVGETLTVSMNSALVGIAMTSNTDGILASATITESNFFDLGEEPVVTAPAAPTNLTAALISNEIQLGWTDNADDEDGFLIERKINAGTYTWLDSLAANTTSYADTTVSAGNTYTYRISAYNTAGVSSLSNETAITTGDTPAADLVLDLPFNGNASDESGNGQNITVNGAQLTTDRFGEASGAYLFNGTSDHMIVDASPSLDVEHITLSAWIYVESYQNDPRIITREKSDAPRYTYSLLLTGTGDKYLQFRLATNGSQHMLLSPTEIPLKSWTHVAATYNGSEMKLYINGRPDASMPASGTIDANPEPIYIGKSPLYIRDYPGKIDELKVYSRGLSATEVLDLYNSGGQIPEPESPSALTATTTERQVQLNWSDNSDDELGFAVERSHQPGSGYAVIHTANANEESYTDTGLVPGVAYYYRIRVFNGLASAWSQEISVTPQLSNEGLARTNTLKREVYLSIAGTEVSNLVAADKFPDHPDSIMEISSLETLSQIGDNYGTRISGYLVPEATGKYVFWIAGDNESQLFLSADEEPANKEMIAHIPGGSGYNEWEKTPEQKSDTMFLYGGMSYYLEVLHKESGGGDFVRVAWSGFNMERQVIPGDYLSLTPLDYTPSAPATPADLLATSMGGNSIQLVWGDKSNNEEGFVIERKTGSGTFAFLDSVDVNKVSYLDLQVAAGISYVYRILAYNATGISAYSNEAGATIITPSEDMALRLPFTGSANDGSGNNLNGTVSGAMLSHDRLGAPNSAYRFDGEDDVIIIPDDSLLDLEYVTLAAWIYLDTYKHDERIISKEYGSTAPHSSYTLMMGGSEYKNLQMRVGINGIRYDRISSEEIPLNTWTHVAATFDGNEIKLYINGILESTHDVPNGALQPNNNPLYIGASQFYPRNFQGKIDEVLVYNRALNGTEVDSLFRAGYILPEPPELTAALVSLDSILLTWTTDPATVQGFVLERKVDDGAFTLLDSLAGSLTEYVDTTFTVNSQYAYRIKAYNPLGQSGFSNEDSVFVEPPITLTTPAGFLVYSLSESEIKIKWQDVSGGQDRFEIYRDDNGDSLADKIINVPAGITEVIDSLLADSVTYAYKIRAKNGFNFSEFTEVKEAMTYSQGLVPDYEEYVALKAIYDSTNGDGWTNNSRWLDGENHNYFGSWYGVFVIDGDVRNLHLHKSNAVGNNLVGRLPESIGKLKELRSLRINNNPGLKGRIPESISQLKKCRYLWIHETGFTGGLPETIGEMESLYEIATYNSNIGGSIPDSFCNLSNLTQMWMHNSGFEGELPLDFGKLKKLWRLYLSGNDLEGELPISFAELHSLWDVRLQNNHFSGNIPSSLGNLHNLSHFDINNNNFTGEIPLSFGNLRNMVWFSLHTNHLTGTIPDTLRNLTKVEVFSVDNNQLTGTIPNWEFNFPNITYFGVSGNPLGGTIPESFSNMTTLEWIDFDECNLEGGLPEYLLTFENLYIIKAYDANFTSIPDFTLHPNKDTLTLLLHQSIFEFKSLEKLFTSPGIHPFDSLSYYSQKNIPIQSPPAAFSGNNVTLASNIGGQYTHYEWQKNIDGAWTNIEAPDDSVLTFTNIQLSDAGEYRCMATNDWVTDLTLHTEPFIVNVVEPVNDIINNYDAVLYVTMDGTDSTAIVNDVGQPWALPHVASVHAHTQAQSDSLKYLVYVRKGTYEDYWVTMPGIDIYFEEDAVVWYNTDNQASRSIISDWRGGAGEYNIYGKGRFYVTTVDGGNDRDAVNFRYNSTLTLECEEFNSMQLWSQFKSPVTLNNITFRSSQLWNTGEGATFNNCTFNVGYHRITAYDAEVGTHEKFYDCTFIFPDSSDMDQALKVLDHRGDSLFTMNLMMPKIKLNTANLTHQEIADLKVVNHGEDPFFAVSCFEVNSPQNPWRGWISQKYNFQFTLVNPTFILDRPNCIAIRIVWNEHNPDIDYEREGIKIIGGKAIAGPNGANPVFFQADKFDSLAADIPINISGTTYDGFTERVYATGYFPMGVTDEGLVPDSVEYSALMAIYNATEGPYWRQKINWGIESVPFGQWSGITVENGDVVQLDFVLNRLRGALPPEIGDLTGLKDVSLIYNEITSIPPQIRNLVNLESLHMAQNQISTIPPELGNLQKLHFISFANNLINNIPDEIGALSNLRSLYLDYNSIYALPLSLFSLSSLESLGLRNNNINSIPSAISNLNNLSYLEIYGNPITIFPKEFWDLANLYTLSMGDHNFTEIPAEIEGLTGLHNLYLAKGGFNTLPSTIGNLMNLRRLDLNENDLNDIPDQIGNLINLKYLTVRSNLLDDIPGSLSNLSNLEVLDLSNNKLTQLNLLTVNLTNLEILDISQNNLITFPQNLRALSSLHNLYASNNKIQSLPPRIGDISNLEDLDVSHNELTSIPDELGNLGNLMYLELQDNELASIPQSIFEIGTLEYIDANNNYLAFQYIEPYYIGSSFDFNFYYSSQYAIPIESENIVVSGNNLTLSSNIGGQHTHYRWQKDIEGVWTDLLVPDAPDLVIENIQLSQFGQYRCIATNDLVADLTLYTETFDVIVDGISSSWVLFARTSGDWHNPNNWSKIPNGPSAGIIPQSYHSVVIDGYNITANNDVEIASLYLNHGVTNSILTIGDNFIVNGQVKFQNSGETTSKSRLYVSGAGRLEVRKRKDIWWQAMNDSVPEHIYENIYVVDNEIGNDQIAVVNSREKPFKSIAAAIAAARNYRDTSGKISLIYVKKGTYRATNIWHPDIHMYFEKNTLVWSEGQTWSSAIILGNINGTGSYKIFGHGRFHTKNINVIDAVISMDLINNPSVLYLECDAIDGFNGSNDEPMPKLTVKGATIKYGVVSKVNELVFEDCIFPAGQTLGQYLGYNGFYYAKNCKYILPQNNIDSLLGVYDHNGNLFFTQTYTRGPLSNPVNTDSLSHQDVINHFPINPSAGNNQTAAFNFNMARQHNWGNNWRNYTIILENCTFEVNKEKCVGIKIVQNYDWEPNGKIEIINPTIIDNSDSETTAVVMFKRNTVISDFPIMIQNINHSCDHLQGNTTNSDYTDLSYSTGIP